MTSAASREGVDIRTYVQRQRAYVRTWDMARLARLGRLSHVVRTRAVTVTHGTHACSLGAAFFWACSLRRSP